MNKMNLSKTLAIAIILLFFSVSVIPSTGTRDVKQITMPTAKGDTLYVGGNGTGNYSKIQDAIDNASDGDTVFVYDDSSPYYENIKINKPINLIGENKETTVIDGKENGDVIKITANIVSINDFKIQNSSKYPQTPGHYGILLVFSNGCCIENNIIQNNSYGIYVPKNSNNNTIINNREL